MWALIGWGLIAVGVVLLVVAAVAHLVIHGIFHEPVEPETHGDWGGMPSPADYSDEVTDEHVKRIAEIVNQDQFEGAEVISGPAWVKFKRAGD